jgi:hypothetical protein
MDVELIDRQYASALHCETPGARERVRTLAAQMAARQYQLSQRRDELVARVVVRDTSSANDTMWNRHAAPSRQSSIASAQQCRR